MSPTTVEPDTRDDVAAPRLISRLARPALALGAGALVALAMPPWGFWPLAVVGVMLFEIALGATPTRRERFLLGYLFGAGWMYLGMGWMIQLTLPGYLVAGSIYALYHAVAARHRARRPVAGDRPAGRPHARRGTALLVPVRRRAAGLARHLAGRRAVPRRRPNRRCHPHHVADLPARFRARRPGPRRPRVRPPLPTRRLGLTARR